MPQLLPLEPGYAGRVVVMFGANVRHCRQLLGLSLRELADRCGGGASFNTISRCERGQDTSLSTAAMIAAGLGVPLHDLLRERDSE